MREIDRLGNPGSTVPGGALLYRAGSNRFILFIHPKIERRVKKKRAEKERSRTDPEARTWFEQSMQESARPGAGWLLTPLSPVPSQRFDLTEVQAMSLAGSKLFKQGGHHEQVRHNLVQEMFESVGKLPGWKKGSWELTGAPSSNLDWPATHNQAQNPSASQPDDDVSITHQVYSSALSPPRKNKDWMDIESEPYFPIYSLLRYQLQVTSHNSPVGGVSRVLEACFGQVHMARPTFTGCGANLPKGAKGIWICGGKAEAVRVAIVYTQPKPLKAEEVCPRYGCGQFIEIAECSCGQRVAPYMGLRTVGSCRDRWHTSTYHEIEVNPPEEPQSSTKVTQVRVYISQPKTNDILDVSAIKDPNAWMKEAFT